jgi:glycosyltransferase involved in cell wall biosynthesis
MSQYPSLSIALLMFNEEECIEAAIDETLAFCRDTLEDWEIIVVDDGSTDSSAGIVENYLTRESRLRLVRHPQNRGMGAGIRSGIENATKEYFIFNASDGQIPAVEIKKLLPHLAEADIVLSTYENMRESVGREVLSRSFRVYMHAIAGIEFRLEGLYLYPTKTAQMIAPLIDSDTFFFSFEMIKRGIERGLTIANTQMRCGPRIAGASKIANTRRIVRVSKEAMRFGFRRWFFYGIDSPKSRF